MKKQRKFAAAVVAILFMFAFSLVGWAQEGRGTGRLSGVVYDTDKNPLEGATVTLEYMRYDRKLTTTTNEKGQWAFMGLGKGIVKVSAEKDGYVSAANQLDVSGVRSNPRQFIYLRSVEEIDVKEKVGEAADTFKKGTALLKERKFEAALALFLDFRQQQPDMYKIGINIGNCYLELQRFDEAITEFQAVVEKIIAETPEVKGNQELARLYASIGDTYMRQNKFKLAEEYFKKSIDIDPADHALAYNVAEILFAAGKTNEAINYYQLAIKIKPDWPKSYMQLGYAYLNKGDTKAAIQSLKKFVELAPDSPETPGVKEVIKTLQ
ncbi:MAG: tetratricopeptide repeat protein [Candidatus Aminicenantes bacterium]|nr:MAG: tetratricopeptide repeat protein [Candidatus Aminicenantes bacterium]